MATIDNLQVEISAITKDFNRSIDGVKGKLSELGSTGDQASTRMMAGFDKVGGVATKALKVGVVGAIAAVAASIPGAVKRIDTLVAFPRVLEAMGASSDEAALATKTLSEQLQGLPTPLQEGAAGVQALVSAGLKVDDATKVFLAFNNATLAASTEAGAAQGAFTQLIQSISKGKIEGQEWNSIVSAMPTAFQALSKESGLTREELRELYRTDPQQLLDDLVELNEKGGGGLASLEEQARAATGGIGTSFENMKNAITRGLQSIVTQLGNGDLEAGQRKISDAITAIGAAFGQALVVVGSFVAFIAVHSDIFGPMAVGIGVAVAAILAYNTYVKLSAIITAAWTTASTIMTLTASLQAQGLGVLRAAWLALNIVMKANPIGLVITAIMAIISALVYFATQTETGRKIFKTAMDGIKAAAEFAWNWIKSNWPLLLAILTGPVGAAVVLIIRNIDTIKKGFSTALSSIKTVWNSAPGFFSGVVSNIGTIFNRVRGYVKSAFDKAVSAIKSIDWTGIGVNIIKGIGGGIASMGGWLANQAKAAVGDAKDKLKSFLGIHSPSRVMRDEIGKMMGLGMAEGIDASTKDAVKSAANSASRVMSAYSGMSVDLPDSKQMSGRLDVEFNSKLAKVDNRLIPVNVQLDGETLLSFVIDGVNGKSFMANHSVIDY